jgi:hypothetical protein
LGVVPSRQSCFAFLAAGLLWLCGVLPAHALHAWPSDGVQNIPISTVKTRVGDFSFAASGRLPWRHELSPANAPGSWGCGYETASGRGEWNARDPNYYSFAGGDPVNRFDSDGRCVEGAGTALGGLLTGTANLVNNTAGALEYALTSSFAPDWAYQNFGGYAQNFGNTVTGTSQLVNNVAATATYGLISPFAPDYAYNNLGGNVQQLMGQAPAFYGGNNQSTAYQIGYGTVNAATMLLGGEEAEVGNLGKVGDVVSTTPRTTFFVTPEGQAIPNIAAADAPVVTTAEPIDLTRFAKTSQASQISVGSYATTTSEATYLQTPEQTISRLGLFSGAHPASGADFFSSSTVIPAGSQVQIGTVQPVILPQGSSWFPAGTMLPGGATEVIPRSIGQ